MRHVPGYLGAVWDAALDEVGKIDLLAGLGVALVTALVGFQIMPLTETDLANLAIWAAVGVLAYFLFHVLVLTPARLWHEGTQRANDPPPATYTFQAGAFGPGSNVHFHGIAPSPVSAGGSHEATQAPTDQTETDVAPSVPVVQAPDAAARTGRARRDRRRHAEREPS